MNSVITWFEIPAQDFDRATQFYEKSFGLSLKREEMDAIAMAVFPHADGQTGGAVVHGAPYQPADNGVCIYLYTDEFDTVLQRIEQNGGKILMPRTSIGPNGFIALFNDSEGNRIGLHTNP